MFWLSKGRRGERTLVPRISIHVIGDSTPSSAANAWPCLHKGWIAATFIRSTGRFGPLWLIRIYLSLHLLLLSNQYTHSHKHSICLQPRKTVNLLHIFSQKVPLPNLIIWTPNRDQPCLTLCLTFLIHWLKIKKDKHIHSNPQCGSYMATPLQLDLLFNSETHISTSKNLSWVSLS